MTHERRIEFIALMIRDLFALSDSIRSSVQRVRISLVHKRIASLFHGIEFFAYSNLRDYYSAFLLSKEKERRSGYLLAGYRYALIRQSPIKIRARN